MRRAISAIRAVAPAAVAAALLAGGCASSTASPSTASSSDSGTQGPASVSGGQDGGGFAGARFETPQRRPSFTLTSDSGVPYDFTAHTKGTPTLLFFGYTHCPDICPATMADVATALRDVPVQVRSKVNVVFVTTDPARDTPTVLATWLRHFDGDLQRRFVGLTGTKAQVEAAQAAAGVPVAEDAGQTHSTQLLLYGPDDLARVFYLNGSSPSDISHDLPLIAEGQHP